MSVPRLVSKVRAPHGGGYTWQDPLLPHSQPVFGTTWEMLIDRARVQRYANSIPTGLSFEDEIEVAICRDYPGECAHDDPQAIRPRHLTLTDVINGTRVMVAHKLAGSPLVPRAEAERRARICSGCAQNVSFPRPCHRCPDLSSLVQTVVGSLGTPYDDDLKSCGICGCYTRIAVWLPLEVQAVAVSEDMRQHFRQVAQNMAAAGQEPCWKASLE